MRVTRIGRSAHPAHHRSQPATPLVDLRRDAHRHRGTRAPKVSCGHVVVLGYRTPFEVGHAEIVKRKAVARRHGEHLPVARHTAAWNCARFRCSRRERSLLSRPPDFPTMRSVQVLISCWQ